MQFRLTYSGLLFSTGNDSRFKGDKRSDHKHNLRMAFHPQLKRLWDVTPFLKTGSRSGPSVVIDSKDETPVYKASYLAKKHAHFGWKFVPLVTKDLDLICGIDILFLRPQRPGTVIRSGDIDGRLKTLLDALSIPDVHQDYKMRKKSNGTTSLYVLLEDDKLITQIAVETDQLLQMSTQDDNECHLVITITLRPYDMTLGNMQFG